MLRLADQCVKCGLCLPVCPTYNQTRHEADSPRGRIALIQGWLTGNLALTATLIAHLDGCLGCRACEAACPSLVAYGQLADAAKAHRVAALPVWHRLLQLGWFTALSQRRITNWIGQIARVYRISGLATISERSGLARLSRLRPYHRMAMALSFTARRLAAHSEPNAALELFIGCMDASAQGSLVVAAIRVCERLNLPINTTSKSTCCGALLRHNGHPAAAAAHLANCVKHHADRQLIGLTSACVAELRTAPELRHTAEICAFLDQVRWPKTLKIKPLPQRVLVHEPCSHRNLLGGNAAVYRLLARIPALEILPLPGNDRCCGAAGTYSLQQPKMAAALLNDKLVAIAALAPTYIVTTNSGCALHIAAELREMEMKIEVCHPVELLARQLE